MTAAQRRSAALVVVDRADDVADARLLLQVLGLIDGPDARELAADPPAPPAATSTDRVGHDEVLAGRPPRPSTAPPGLYLVPDRIPADIPAPDRAAVVPRAPRVAARPATGAVGRPRARKTSPATELTATARRSQAVCGTLGGYSKHSRESTPYCQPCRAANAQAQRARYKPRPRRVAACGTPSGYERHRRLGEACEVCRVAMAEASRAKRANRRAESGTMRRRVAACGTPSGYQRHRNLGEPTCQPCRDAIKAYQRARKAARAGEQS